MEKSREELIEELKLELNPGSMTIEGLIEKMVDMYLGAWNELQDTKSKLSSCAVELEQARKSSDNWYESYRRVSDKAGEMMKTMDVLVSVTNELTAKWKD